MKVGFCVLVDYESGLGSVLLENICGTILCTVVEKIKQPVSNQSESSQVERRGDIEVQQVCFWFLKSQICCLLLYR